MSEYIINLDLHGGDFAPQSVLEGALIAQTKNSSIKFNLHSDRHIYEKFKSPFSKLFNNSKWTQSENFISPDMKPSDALKKLILICFYCEYFKNTFNFHSLIKLNNSYFLF